MNPPSNTAVRRVTEYLSKGRLTREWKTVSAMLHIYCRDQHHGALCPECRELKNYVSLRLTRCRFGADKPTCAKCPVHCYQRERRDHIKVVMRYAGPRMLWEHPWLSLWHVLDGWFRRPALADYPSKSKPVGNEINPPAVQETKPRPLPRCSATTSKASWQPHTI